MQALNQLLLSNKKYPKRYLVSFVGVVFTSSEVAFTCIYIYTCICIYIYTFGGFGDAYCSVPAIVCNCFFLNTYVPGTLSHIPCLEIRVTF